MSASDAPDIRFPCTGCGKSIKAPAKLAGRAVACPHCKAKQPVPAPAARDDDTPYTFSDPPPERRSVAPLPSPVARQIGLPKRDTKVAPEGYVLPDEEEPATGRTGGTDLHSKALVGDLEGVRALLNGGTDVNALDRKKRTALHLAAGAGYRTTCALLIARGVDVQARDSSKATALHTAAANDRKAIAALLLSKGLDLEAKANDRTPLHVAAEAGHIEMCRMLLAWGANPSTRGDHTLDTPGKKVETWEFKRWSPLHDLAWNDEPNLELAELLLIHGAHPNITAKERTHGDREPAPGMYTALPPMDVAAIKYMFHDGGDAHKAFMRLVAGYGGTFAWVGRFVFEHDLGSGVN